MAKLFRVNLVNILSTWVFCLLFASVNGVTGIEESHDQHSYIIQHRAKHRRAAAFSYDRGQNSLKSKMSLAPRQAVLVKAQEGSTGILHCINKNPSSGVVSWVRLRDYVILTIGFQTYTTDERYKLVRTRHSQDWALHIKHISVKDAGFYECHISSHPPKSVYFNLTVVYAYSEILGGQDKFIKKGSLLHLECKLMDSTETPTYIFWYHFDRMINFDVDTGYRFKTEVNSSHLIIDSAVMEDSGNYTCEPSNAKPSSIMVHVLNDEKPAAMQQGSNSLSNPAYIPELLLSGFLISSCYVAWIVY